MANSAQTATILQKYKSAKPNLRKSAIFQPLILDGLAKWGRSTSFPHAYRGKSAFFPKGGVSPDQIGLCVDGPCRTTACLQNAPGAPAARLPEGPAGSQSALYTHVSTHGIAGSAGYLVAAVLAATHPEFGASIAPPFSARQHHWPPSAGPS